MSGGLSRTSRAGHVSYGEQAHERALRNLYLERGSVHAYTLLCTGGYTEVYTRVHFSLLDSRYTLGKATPRV